jgi:biotin-dependent carboxylase-like uncharacterized protein
MINTLTVHSSYRAAVTDLGRFGSTHYGISTNGAADQYSARAANILVDNPDGSPLVEISASDLVFTVKDPMMIAVTGAPAEIRVDGITRPQWTPFVVASGSTVAITDIRMGMHTYLAIRGTCVAAQFRGSCAPDPLLGVGTTLWPGSRLHVRGDFQPFDHPHLPLFLFEPHIPRFTHSRVLDVLDGPAVTDFGETAALLTTSEYVVGHQSNTVGTRLEGPAPTRRTNTEILSRGVPLGAVEVPPAGELIVLQRGRPVTAGYPVVAVVARASRDDLGQLRPGDTVRFRPTTLADARDRYSRQQHHLHELRQRVRTAFRASGIHLASHAACVHQQQNRTHV